MNLTPKQLRILKFIQDYKTEHKYAPTLEEIAGHFGVSTVTVFEHMQALERKGAIRRQKHKARSAEILPQAEELAFEIPVAGCIMQDTVVEEPEAKRTLSLADLVGSERNHVALEVRGDVMSAHQIRSGDYVVIEKRASVGEGEKVLALVRGGGPVLGTYRLNSEKAWLETDKSTDASLASDRFDIQGVVVGIVRSFTR